MQTGPSLQLRQKRTLVASPQLRQAIGMLQMSNAALRDLLTAEAAKNPYLDVRVPNRGTGVPQGAGEGGDDRIPDYRPGLLEHVFSQIDLCVADGRQREIAFRFAEALEPSGWLGRTVAGVAQDCRCSVAEAEAVLRRLQTCEPAGLFARDLRECLMLQAAERGLLDPVMRCVLDNLQLVADGRVAELGRLCGTDAKAIRDCLGRIRQFNPKPGADFQHDPALLREPDVIVTRAAGGWQVDLNRSTLPAVELREGVGGPQGVAAAEALRAARWLQRALDQRNRTTLAVAATVVRRQAAFLERGPIALRPLRLADVAADLEIHESTVSRVCSGLLLDTPRGVLPMRDFFCTPVGTSDDGEPLSAAAVRHRLIELVTGEDPGRPLSDAALSALLAAEGTVIARRTVAKYREMLRIPHAGERRRRARAGRNGLRDLNADV